MTMFAALFACQVALAADPATLVRKSELRAEPYSDADVVATLEAETPLTVEKRRGGWYHVEAAGRTGWVPMIRVRLISGAGAGEGDSGVAEALGLVTTGRSGASGVTVATGIRGLDAASMVNASPDYAAVARLDQMGVSADAARRYAERGKLKAQAVAYSRRADGEGNGPAGAQAPAGKSNPQGGLPW